MDFGFMFLADAALASLVFWSVVGVVIFFALLVKAWNAGGGQGGACGCFVAILLIIGVVVLLMVGS